MELKPYRANVPHHRASLKVNLKYWQLERKAEPSYYAWSRKEGPAHFLEARIRRDLESLNGMAGVW